ncbi:CopG domain protein DNA-binding domain protein [Scytonema sp. HK-05]|nr:CopG domain protein DNA-binding domain protein [Scytonema sp. HK-05]
MKAKGLHIRISERRLNKIRMYAANKEKTITQIIEDYIDRLPTTEIDNFSTTPLLK